ncbi:MAG: Trm112 family protein [Candidatus Aminicenantia bacterium]
MRIDKELLEILACPLCKEEVKVVKNGEGLQCVKCKRIYPVRDGIPIMLIEEAYFEEEKNSE